MNYNQACLVKGKNFHLYIPWGLSLTSELMYEYKKMLFKHEFCLIPFLHLNEDKAELSDAELDEIEAQIKMGLEVRLYMTNFDSIHAYRVSEIIKHPSKNIKNYKDNISERYHQCHPKFWIKVDDVMVLDTKYHQGKKNAIEFIQNHAEKSNKIFELFRHGFPVGEQVIKRWVEVQRSVSSLYLMKQNELKESTFLGVWDSLHEFTRHFLTESEKMRQESYLLINEEKLKKQQVAFDFYKTAILFEFNQQLIVPILEIYEKSESLQETLRQMHKQKKDIGAYKFFNEKKVLQNFSDVQDFFKRSRSFFFTLSTRYQKKIEEEPLKVEAKIKSISGRVDTLLARHFDQILERLVTLDNIGHGLSQGLLEDEFNLYKFSKIVSQLLSEKGDHNPLYLIHLDYLKKDKIQRTLDQEISDLQKSLTKKVA